MHFDKSSLCSEGLQLLFSYHQFEDGPLPKTSDHNTYVSHQRIPISAEVNTNRSHYLNLNKKTKQQRQKN
jgi:hypothetical protein